MSRSSPSVSLRRAWLFASFAALVLVGGCSCAPECKPGFTDTCYPGPEGTAGIGLCRSGIEQCLNGRLTDLCQGVILPTDELCDGADNDCDGTVDEEVRNACGGCSLLEGIPGETCAPCAKWECRGLDLVTCPPPAQTIGAECENDSGCPGTIRCQGDGTLRCAGPRANACGVCGGSEVEGLGGFCTDGECPGVFVCDGLGQSAVCETIPRNNCGVCNTPDVEFLGDTCTPDEPGACLGVYECNEAGDDTVCVSPTRNECGACDGPAIPDLGDPCEVSGCAGTKVCHTLGLSTYCRPDPSCVITANDVVISEFSGADVNSGTNSDFIELYNPTTAPKSLAGWTLWYGSDRGTDSSLIKIFTFASGTEIQPRGYFLLGRARSGADLGYEWDPSFPTRAPDVTITQNMSASGGKLYLARTADRPGVGSPGRPSLDPDVVDMVGWGSANDHENSATAPGHLNGGSIERKASEGSTVDTMVVGGIDELLGNGHDSNDNARDWIARPVRDPQNSTAPAEPELVETPDAGTPTDPDAGTPTDPDAGTPADPDAGMPTDPDAGPVDPPDAGI